MKIFVLGGAGFIGKSFLKKFSKQYEIVLNIKNSDISDFQKFIGKDVIIEKGNVENDEIIDKIVKHSPDIILHLAALTGIKKCNENPQSAFNVNVYGTYNVVKACEKTSSKIVFLSSREVYGSTKNENSKEEDLLLPNNIYGITKMIGEQLIQNASKKYNLDYTILRPTNVYGPEGRHGINHIIKDAVNNKKIQIFGGDQIVNFVYIDDVTDVLHKVLNSEKSSKQIFNVGSEENLTINEFVNRLSGIINEDIKFEYNPMQEGDSLRFKPDLKKIKSTLNYSPKILEEGLKETIEWIQKNP